MTERTDEKQILSVPEAAELVGVDKSYIRRLVLDKVIPAQKLGGTFWMIHRRDLLEWDRRRKMRKMHKAR